MGDRKLAVQTKDWALVKSVRATAVCRKLVGHFKHSAIAMTALKQKQEQLNLEKHHLIQDVHQMEQYLLHVDRLLEQRGTFMLSYMMRSFRS